MLKEKHKKYLGKFISDQYLDIDFIQKSIEEFNKMDHVKHLVFEKFLRDDISQLVLSDLKTSKFEYDDLYTDQKGYKKGTGAYVSGKHLARIRKFFFSTAFYEYMSLYLGKKVYTPQRSLFLLEEYLRKIIFKSGISTQIYNNQDYLTWHTDGPIGVAAGSYVFFLTETWNTLQGGDLQLGQKDNLAQNNIIPYKSIFPEFNTFVFFKCEENLSWHRVNKVEDGKRITIHNQLFYK